MPLLTIRSLASSEIRPFLTLRASKTHFIAESEEVVKHLLTSSFEVEAMLMLPKYKDLAPSDIPVYLADEALLKSIVGYKMHQGIMALVKIPENAKINELTLPIVALDGLANSENVGAIVRNAVAFGVSSILMSGTTSPPYLRRSVKVSRGAIFYATVHQTDDLPTVCQSFDVPIIGLDPKGDAVTTLPREAIYVFGSEGKGISSGMKDVITEKVAIPIDPRIDSLNVAATSAIVLSNLLK
ncbi:MAG: 23S rRNA (guanosine-2'-O-)-methyltransferase RlmB [Chlamydiia bacterium]|nr:23S rRNA (guanosine-2'-O-)-methyltransferase RlmB [Chlamydiia bacterium]MCH9616041.1 23S rRNA (guanosine-2'-O-)-methyltransferase RlmB [Chlamydiia bacterium]MCH9629064.1 23S rRNA (guanosine-2'-O-)-methyltransferase RlmB [Chlamydiia bacterium]